MIPLDQAHHLGAVSMAGARAGHRANVRTSFGFTAPTILYEEIRAIDQDATRLDSNVTAYVPLGTPFRASWAAWIANWRAFRDKHLDSNYEKLATLFTTDALAQQIETYRQQLQSLYADYGKLGAGTPALAPPGPVAPPLVPGQTTSPATGKPEPSLLPWWAWMGLGVAAIGGVYWGYRKYVAPKVAKWSGRAAHDPPLRMRRLPPSSRDELALVQETALYEHAEPDPLSLAEYASDPRSQQGFCYRPYVHPHLVPAALPARRHAAPPPHWNGWSSERDHDEEGYEDE